ncbi:PREDICTED: kinesin-like calmodulin-binding protein [Populus euphratica]|uniref:Kinesin-like calmodulin-binding protein n=1 Tax=Populus euphratica TaxID=75702 RepID=A0AAJ6T421_POPEU|nr:PREDICTED: kinesin-like calmodulin-binding protein [Populus euphratica]
MFIPSEVEQISLPLDNVKEKLEPMEPNQDYIDAFQLESELMDSPPLPNSTIYTDVNVVPEHEKGELEHSISNLEGEIAGLKRKERLLDKKRREALNKILDIKGSIRVFCRVRPFLLSDRRRIHEPISIGLEKVVVKSVGIRKEYRYDKVFHQAATQEDVFVEVEPILRSALDGHNVCILAYGQTGTGKTFTMDGTNNQAGIIPRAIEELFRQASLDNSSITFSMSMLEVYMGNLRDLLAPKVASRTYEVAAKCLNIQTDPKGMVEVEGLTQVQIPDTAKAKWWYAKGRRARSTSWTNVNETSSRSHCLMRITISRHGDDSKAKAQVSKLWMVDLGGSERLLKTGATGQTMDEGRAINLSLSALGDVIAALRRKRGHVPYRNSKLTQILKDSLGHSSKVLMLVHISPCEEDVGETICSLSFANRARAIETYRDLTEDINMQRQKRILELEVEMREAEEECQKVRYQVHKAEFLLSENRELLSTTYHVPDDKENAPLSPKEDYKEVNSTSQVTDKGIRRNMTSPFPRFMTSTVASRQRQSAAEKLIVGRARSLRSATRSSLQFSASQSFSYSEFRFRAILKESNRKSRYGETKPRLPESPKCNVPEMKMASLPRSKTVISSDPNLRTTLSRHRRRMSDLI